MADSRKARREADPGLQPERTSLAWLRTLLGYGALIALAIKHNWHRTGLPFWISLVVLALVATILWRYTRSRNLMDVNRNDFVQPKAVRDKFLISLAVLSLALLFAVTHLQQILIFLRS
ncbi:Inner membrane protein YidG [compost metagenome]